MYMCVCISVFVRGVYKANSVMWKNECVCVRVCVCVCVCMSVSCHLCHRNISAIFRHRHTLMHLIMAPAGVCVCVCVCVLGTDKSEVARCSVPLRRVL